jgi:predicted PurR-regulated permease PerM
LAIIPVVSEQVATIVDRAPDWFNELRTNRRIQEVDRRYDVILRVENFVQEGGWTQRVFGGVLGVGIALLSAVANALIVIVLTLYFLASLPKIKRFGYRLAPASKRPRVTELGDRILRNVGGYVSGAFLVAFCAGFASLIFLFVIGLGEYAVALAMVVALLDVIPMIGATLGALVVTAIGFATEPRIGLFCLVFYIAYQQFENYVIYPRVMQRSVDIHGSLIVIAALVGAALLGVVGALLAIPTAAAIQLVVKEVFIQRQDAR